MAQDESGQMAEVGKSQKVMQGLRLVLAPNPSPMTYRGTNSYILGRGEVAVIDPGPDDPAHLAALLGALEPGERISHIFVTHAHRDHSALAPALARATGAPVLAFGSADAGRSDFMEDLASREPPRGKEGVDQAFMPDLTLADGSLTKTESWALRAHHTPGHFGNHLCLEWGDQLFVGDHVMGWSSSIVAPPDGDMAAYLASLSRIGALGATRLWPGHGDAVETPAGRIEELIRHRTQRREEIAARLAEGPANATSLAQSIYTDTDPRLLGAAALNVFAHLIELTQRNEAAPLGTLTFSTLFRSH